MKPNTENHKNNSTYPYCHRRQLCPRAHFKRNCEKKNRLKYFILNLTNFMAPVTRVDPDKLALMLQIPTV